MDHALEPRPKPGTQAEVRPIWGGFVASGGTSAARHAAEPTSRVVQPPTMPPAPDMNARVGSMERATAQAEQHGALTLRLNSRSVATFAGFAAAAAFVLVVFLGSVIGVRPAAATASVPQPAVPVVSESVTWSGGPAQTSLSVGEYGEQVAIATLTSSLHEVSTNSVTFYADPDRSGNALQQFSEIFGEAIATGRNPLRPGDDRGPGR